jgi:hypothetical protein
MCIIRLLHYILSIFKKAHPEPQVNPKVELIGIHHEHSDI